MHLPQHSLERFALVLGDFDCADFLKIKRRSVTRQARMALRLLGKSIGNVLEIRAGCFLQPAGKGG
jgi:hypothetical protein